MNRRLIVQMQTSVDGVVSADDPELDWQLWNWGEAWPWDDALKAEDDIVSGKPFDKVFDAWRAKAKQARRFTRVLPDQLPPELAKALSELRNGDSTKTPVKTEFGWHVVHLDIANPYTPPPFDQVKDGLRRNLQMKIGRERLDKLREQAKIEYAPNVKPPTKAAEEAPAAPTAPAAPAAKN